MKLKHLKLKNSFRGLPKGFEIEFSQIHDTQSINPYCVVGLNGSGKSNLLELIAEIYYTLEQYALRTQSSVFGKRKNFYSSDLFKNNQNFTTNIDFDLEFETPQNIDDIITNYRIIGYSSGMNEILSNPFIKMDFHYFDEFQNRVKHLDFSSLDINRMFYMDYESNKMVTLANMLIPDIEGNTSLEVLHKELAIDDLHAFSIFIRRKRYDGDPIEFPSELNQAIHQLEKCATCYQTYKDGKIEITQLDFWINEATKKAFRRNFRTAFELFRYLYLLRLLNIHAYRPTLRQYIKDLSSSEVNLSSLIPKPDISQLVFSIDNITLRKRNIVSPVNYRNLSDGEHQLMHILGALILFDTRNTLFLLDEPETHFNPEWRSKFISLMNKAISKKRDQEIILTTHSPFIVSDCKPEKVFIFQRNENNEVVYFKPDFNTFGASVNLITLKVFGKKETISEVAINRIRELQTEVEAGAMDSENAQMIIFSELGDSIEKMIAIESISKLS